MIYQGILRHSRTLSRTSDYVSCLHALRSFPQQIPTSLLTKQQIKSHSLQRFSSDKTLQKGRPSLGYDAMVQAFETRLSGMIKRKESPALQWEMTSQCQSCKAV